MKRKRQGYQKVTNCAENYGDWETFRVLITLINDEDLAKYAKQVDHIMNDEKAWNEWVKKHGCL